MGTNPLGYMAAELGAIAKHASALRVAKHILRESAAHPYRLVYPDQRIGKAKQHNRMVEYSDKTGIPLGQLYLSRYR